ncbi:TPA: hypothetical protein N0F65_009552 [Lagenidium giganteum]|uniref:Uncharacterized protein n=1 Tax=Lagenidium giganteum TaxID=4803 RepID=A0AAV2YQT5_9STRA|nr:TPA: hypothetical protein N0F65_009552 [Lagenidium giganteum]
MTVVDRRLLLPVMLLLDFALFVYLVAIYRARWREWRVMQLFIAAFLGFAVLIPFDQEDPAKTQSLNDVSETCSQLLFLIQIIIIGKVVTKKVKLSSIRCFTVIAEVLVLLDWANVGMNFAQVANAGLDDTFHKVANVIESTTLMFVLVFRFYYLSLSKGFCRVVRERRLEFGAYVLMVTHEVPIYVLELYTSGSWEYVQGIYMRTMIIICIMLNLRKKQRDARRSMMPATSLGMSSAPSMREASEVSKLDSTSRRADTSPSAAHVHAPKPLTVRKAQIAPHELDTMDL